MPNESKSSELSDPIPKNGIPLHKKKIEWKEYRLGEITDSCLGKMLDQKKNKGMLQPYLGNANVRWGTFDLKDLSEMRFLDSESERYGLRYGDLIICEGGEPGRCAIWKDQISGMKIQKALHRVRVHEGFDCTFLYYWFLHAGQRNALEQYFTGTTIKHLPGDRLKSITVSLPSLSEQKRIASILGSLDDKIDLLHRQNATLEAMAETLFRHHFIENPNPDWKEGVIADVIDFNPPRKLGKGEFAPFLEMSNLSADVYAPIAWRDRAFGSGTKFINGDTLLARITPCLENGKAAYIDFLDSTQVGWGSTEYIVMRPKRKIHPFFAYIIAKYQDFRDYAESCMSGSSGRQRVDVDNLKTYRFCIPDAIAVEQFNRNIVFLVGKMANNNNEIRCLKSLSNVLLPRLMSNMSLSL